LGGFVITRTRSATLAIIVALILFLARPSPAQEAGGWHDPSPHSIQFVTVDKNVSLEVLDWGGSGRPIVLSAALGNTAHVFDDFAPKLAGTYHVYGITRRGFGASSAPASGYSADQLGDDVITVIDSFKLSGAVLAGHSIAGEELSSVGTRHPEKISGLIYLEAANEYAFYDRSRGEFLIDSLDLQKKLRQLQPGQQADLKQLIRELLDTDLPQFERDLQRTQTILQSVPPPMNPQPDAADRASFTAYRAWQSRALGIAMPESELRQNFEATQTGGVGNPRRKSTAANEVLAGEQKYLDIRVPVLAIFANGGPQADFLEKTVRSAHVVRMANASHYIFLSHESDVLREMRDFLANVSSATSK
jgi:pimeloyl-ACP methyl ester carboxylesterase